MPVLLNLQPARTVEEIAPHRIEPLVNLKKPLAVAAIDAAHHHGHQDRNPHGT